MSRRSWPLRGTVSEQPTDKLNPSTSGRAARYLPLLGFSRARSGIYPPSNLARFVSLSPAEAMPPEILSRFSSRRPRALSARRCAALRGQDVGVSGERIVAAQFDDWLAARVAEPVPD